MKNIEFTQIFVENFGRHRKPVQSQLGHRTLISGANCTGKSTIKRACQWVLGSRDENGKEITGIRPHDENGVDIDGLTTVAEIGVSVDEKPPIALKKIYHQNRNKKGEISGNSTECYVADLLKKTKDYEEYVSGILPDEVCINASSFLNLDTAHRRAYLEKAFSTHTTDSIIDEFPEFEPIRQKLSIGTVEELKKQCRTAIKGDKNHKGLESLRDEIPARIDEIEKQRVDIDVAELELLKNSLKEQIAENRAKQEDVSKQFEEFDKQSKDILDLQFELNGLQQQANLDLEKKRREIRTQIDDVDRELKEVAHQLRLNRQDIQSAEESIKSNEIRIQTEFGKWNDCNNELNAVEQYEFDENSLICSMCGQEYPNEKKEEIRDDFDAKKKDKIEQLKAEKLAIEKRGEELKASIKKDKAEIEQLKATKKENEDEEINLKESIKGLEDCLAELPDSIDISDREDVKKLKQQIAEKEQAMSKGSSAEGIRQQLKDECEDLQNQLNEAEKKIALAQNNIKIDERVEQLRKEQLELSQKIADVEKELDLLKSFERKKAELLETDVNANFEFVQFRMFEQMVNSDLKDVCQILVGGESYDRNLNFSNKILAEIDICRGFQRHYGIVAPVLLDNAESVNDFRLPQIPNQMIIFKCTEEPQLTIKNLE